jgi:hypothetical protein
MQTSEVRPSCTRSKARKAPDESSEGAGAHDRVSLLRVARDGPIGPRDHGGESLTTVILVRNTGLFVAPVRSAQRAARDVSVDVPKN